MFRSGRVLLFAKTAVKETAPKKRAAPAAAAKKAKPAAKSEWQHKGGWGLKFYRKQWAKYPEPSYWTVTRYKPSTRGHKQKVWGVLTWRGLTEERPREVVGIRKAEWKYLKEGDFTIPLNTPRSLARAQRAPPPDTTTQPGSAQEESTTQTATAAT